MKKINFLMNVMVFFVTSWSFAQYDALLNFGINLTLNEAKLKEMNYKKTTGRTVPNGQYTLVISNYKNTAGEVIAYLDQPYNDSNTSDWVWTSPKLYTAEGIMNFLKSHKSQIEDNVSNVTGGSTIDWDVEVQEWDKYGGEGFKDEIKSLKNQEHKFTILGFHPKGTRGYIIMKGNYFLDNSYNWITYIALEVNSPKGKMYKLCMQLVPNPS